MVDDFRMGDEHRLMNLIQRIIARIVQMFFLLDFQMDFLWILSGATNLKEYLLVRFERFVFRYLER